MIGSYGSALCPSLNPSYYYGGWKSSSLIDDDDLVDLILLLSLFDTLSLFLWTDFISYPFWIYCTKKGVVLLDLMVAIVIMYERKKIITHWWVVKW